MNSVKFNCPVCGAPHEWRSPVPVEIACGNCESTLQPLTLLTKYELTIYEPGSEEYVLWNFRSNTPFLSFQAGDEIHPASFGQEYGRLLSVSKCRHLLEKRGGYIYHEVQVFPKSLRIEHQR